jgi:hypothetical protein
MEPVSNDAYFSKIKVRGKNKQLHADQLCFVVQMVS